MLSTIHGGGAASKKKITRMLLLHGVALILVSACGGGHHDDIPVVSSVNPTKAIFNVPTTFVLTGTNLPLEGEVAFQDGVCEPPASRSTTHISVACISTASNGVRQFYVSGVTQSMPGAMLELTTDLPPPPLGAVVPVSDDGYAKRMDYRQVPGFEAVECVYDAATGLTWESKQSNGPRSYKNLYTNVGNGPDDVATYIETVNNSELCGYKNWRIPNLIELMSLVDYSIETDSNIRAISQFWFPYTGYEYWTASAAYSGYLSDRRRKLFYIVDFAFGQVYVGYASEPQRYAVRLVRN